MIDCIEHNVSQAVDYVEVAAENVNIAEKYHKEAVKVMIYISNLIYLYLFFVLYRRELLF